MPLETFRWKCDICQRTACRNQFARMDLLPENHSTERRSQENEDFFLQIGPYWKMIQSNALQSSWHSLKCPWHYSRKRPKRSQKLSEEASWNAPETPWYPLEVVWHLPESHLPKSFCKTGPFPRMPFARRHLLPACYSPKMTACYLEVKSR